MALFFYQFTPLYGHNHIFHLPTCSVFCLNFMKHTNFVFYSLHFSFRLLNSEIGNDQFALKLFIFVLLCFRLLNSEIGNDPMNDFNEYVVVKCFRLLNSEIGNDPSNIKMASEWGLRP